MTNCNHTFPYWSVQPPSHCPCCGACLHPVRMGPYPPIMPYPWPHPGPYYTTVVTNNTGGFVPPSSNLAMVA